MKNLIFLFSLGLLFSCAPKGKLPHVNAASEAPESTRFALGEAAGTPSDSRLVEASGLVASARFPGALWSHNDSGSEPLLFLIDSTGRSLATYRLPVDLRDWEDIALREGSGYPFLLVAEIGDNRAVHEEIQIHMFPEPGILSSQNITPLEKVQTLRLRYPDGARDAETLLADPKTGEVFIITKREEKARLYRVPDEAFVQKEEVHTLEFVQELAETGFVGGDISPDGSQILLKRYPDVLYWERKEGESIPEALAREGERLPYVQEPQGESIAFRRDGQAYYTLSEEDGDDAPLLLYRKAKP